ncbi:SHOCT domain-containing protein [Nocardia sp. NPDC059177]|uniref:SHOCT domain-containing protein n=1 Tax=Nocardia sp. NPDC059177 TaxID=3346759 RepID=UPI0036AB9864
MSFWDVVWLIIITFLFIAYLMMVFTIITDLFRDRDTSGWVKAVWIVCLFIFPFITALVYLIVRGNSMSERTVEAQTQARATADSYIRATAGTDSASQIAGAKKLLDDGTITEAEFASLKTKALS